MKAKILAAVLILSGLFVTYEVSYAGCGGSGNQYPVAILTAEPEHVAVDCNVILDGNDSYDPDGDITKYEWDFTDDGTYDYNETSSYYPDGAFDGNTVHDYNTPGTYTANLRVTDNDNATDTDTCTVHVVGINNTNKGTWYVTIQAAINDADNGDEIVVYPDTYYENIDFNGVSCTLISTDPNDWDVVSATIIDANDSDANTVRFETKEDANSVLRGFTITGGARGIYCYSASPTIRDCVISGNGSGSNDGGGIYTYNSSVVVTNCLLRENDANCGGGMYNINSSPTVANCIFGENDANCGGGMYNINSSPTVANCVFGENDANSGGGIYDYNSSPSVVNCTFIQNSAYYGGGIYDYNNSSPTVANCLFGKNDANSGGGMYDYNSSPSVVNCTFSGNSADYGGGMYNYGVSSEPNVTNCIFWGNQADSDGNEIYNAALADPNFSYCDINGCGGSDNWDPNFGTDDGGNIDEDPMFRIVTYPPVSHWRFDEAEGSTAYDSAGDNDGTIYGATWTTGQISGALSFDGDGDYINVPDSNSLDCLVGSNERTISAWVKVNTWAENKGIWSAGSALTLKDFSLEVESTEGNLTLNHWYGDLYFTIPSDHYGWHLITVVYNGTDTLGYVDAAFRNSITVALDTSDTDFHIGHSLSHDTYFNGIIDDVQIYDRALSTWEIQQLYPNGWSGYHLSLDSPCINGGDPNGSYDGQMDIDGEPRVMGSRVDIGADEVMIWFVDANADGSDDGTSWEDAFDDLQDALAVAGDGEAIWVAEGTYKPDVNDPNNRALSFELVEGVGVYGGFDGNEIALEERVWVAHPTILSGDINEPNDANDNSYHVVVGADSAILDGFIITGGYADGSDANSYGGGIYCDQSSFTIRRCIISDNTAQADGGGIYCEDSDPILTNCVIVENEAGDDGGGIYDCNSSPRLINCTFSGNYADSNGGGMFNYGAYSDPNVTNCIFWDNVAGSDGNEIHNEYNSDPNFSYCDIQGCGGSGPNDWDPNFGSDDGGNIDSEPKFIDPNDADGNDDIFMTIDDGLRLEPNSPCIDAADGDAAPLTDLLGSARVDINYIGNTGTGNPDYADIGAYEVVGTVYNTTKGLLYPTIQSALNYADGNDIIKVYPGTYYETINFNGKAITLTSTDPDDPNIVAATIIDGNDVNNVVTFNSGEDTSSVITGFTITNKDSDNYYGVYSPSNNYSSPTISNCIIGNCSQGVRAFWSDFEMTNCTISNCSYGVICSKGSPKISYCEITDCGIGMALGNYSGAAEVTNCRIINNNSGGVDAYLAGEFKLKNCLIKDNGAFGIKIRGDWRVGPSEISNLTIDGHHFGVKCWAADLDDILVNCILWNNTCDFDYPDYFHADYSCIKNLDSVPNAGLGNFSVNPNFADSNLHLDTNSFCIDAGLPCSDYSKEPTPNGGRINVGAYGNTSEATTTTDTDSDGISDSWEKYYWPSDDPNQHDPNDDLENGGAGDGFSNWIEYLFGYDPNEVTTEPFVFVSGWDPCSTGITQIDPTKNETFTINYLLNMDANIVTSFTKTEDAVEPVWTNKTTTSGSHQIAWDGTDDVNGMIVERYFYDVSIDINDGQEVWESLDGGNSSPAIPAEPDDYGMDACDFSAYAYQNIPVTISCNMSDWCTRTIDVVEEGCSSCRIYRVTDDRLLKPGWNTFYWYGHWDVDPNTGQLCKEPFDVYFHVSDNINLGAVLVYYEELLANLRCNPYRILPLSDEVTTITYDLASDANVTIDIYDPDGSYFGTLLEEQEAGPQEVIWYGTNKDPNDPNSRYISTEGVYRVDVQMENMSEKLEGAITVYK